MFDAVSTFTFACAVGCVSPSSLVHNALSATSPSSVRRSSLTIASSPSMAFCSSPVPAFELLEGAGAARSIDIVSKTLFPSMVSVCYCTLIMRNDTFALGINLSNIGLSAIFELLVLTTSGSQSKNNS